MKDSLISIYNTIKGWFQARGVTEAAFMIAGVALFLFGQKFFAGVATGIFFWINKDIILDYIKSLFTTQTEDKS